MFLIWGECTLFPEVTLSLWFSWANSSRHHVRNPRRCEDVQLLFSVDLSCWSCKKKLSQQYRLKKLPSWRDTTSCWWQPNFDAGSYATWICKRPDCYRSRAGSSGPKCPRSVPESSPEKECPMQCLQAPSGAGLREYQGVSKNSPECVPGVSRIPFWLGTL